jgi:hypothetical protein
VSSVPAIPFIEFPKIARLSREIIVTEKLDGTNAQIYIPDRPICFCGHADVDHEMNVAYLNRPCKICIGGFTCTGYNQVEQQIFAGSRTKWITPEDDNKGFARWVEVNREKLLKLGPGSHFGEWWGSGIARGYGLTKGEKRFSLFNVSRWGPGGMDETLKPECCSVVPTLGRWET